VALAEGDAFDDYLSGTGDYAEQALRRLSDRLRERRGPTTRLSENPWAIPRQTPPLGGNLAEQPGLPNGTNDQLSSCR
jgi:hypothetical protein